MKIDINKAADFFEKSVGFSALNKPNARKQIPHRIVWKGQHIKLKNGKCAWPSLGAAKAALRQKVVESRLIEACVIDIDEKEVSWTSQYTKDKYYSTNYKQECYLKTLRELERAGFLKFEPIT